MTTYLFQAPPLLKIQLFIALCIFLTALYHLINSPNLIKSIISFGLLNTSVIVFFILLSTRSGGGTPIIGDSPALGNMIDPLPQALMITAIIIGAASTSLALMISIKLFHYYGSLQWKDIYARRSS